MPRPVAIDRQRASKAAMKVFWERGYGATSIQDLLTATGMGAGSFYAAFGSKAELFSRNLAEYAQSSHNQLLAARQHHRGLDALTRFLEATFLEVSDSTRSLGCLLLNSVVELAGGVEPALQAQARGYLQRFRSEVFSGMQEARELGQLDPRLDPDQATDLLMTLMHGLRGECRGQLSRDQASQQIENTIRLLSKGNKEID